MAAISGLSSRLNILVPVMRIKLLGSPETAVYKEAENMIRERGHEIVESLAGSDLAIAPLLTEIIPEESLMMPDIGTLIFHPSPLPYGRGASSIKWAYRRKEPITAATWFWADKRIDAGPICEQEIVKIDYELRPRDFYEKHIIPAMMRTLKRCLIGIESGFKREIDQVEGYATYDKII